jgi:hypothetical protein
MEMFLLVLLAVSSVVAGVSSAVAWKLAHERREETAARVEALRSLTFPDETTAMFGASAEPSAPKRRLVAVAVVALVMASIAGTVFALHDERPSVVSRPAGTPIELRSLRLTDVRGTLIVAGEVRTSTPDQLGGLQAQVDLLDGQGRRVASGAAPLALRSGDAADDRSFSVVFPETAQVARYRVQFERADGSLVPHLDRRAPRGERQ